MPSIQQVVMLFSVCCNPLALPSCARYISPSQQPPLFIIKASVIKTKASCHYWCVSPLTLIEMKFPIPTFGINGISQVDDAQRNTCFVNCNAN
mmetsp:Transcript_15118/g.22275  ORF Transcript_15118/g.22275 Transcript_15118/m.22275 type:complete len:93 (-) Transcript_15118:171-449(-)